MKIKNMELKNFKRFTDLVISDIPDTSKLVLLIGSNGSGKSSIFDAFGWLKDLLQMVPSYSHSGIRDEANYYRKNQGQTPDVMIELTDGRKVEGGQATQGLKGWELTQNFFGRSSIRIIPRITNNTTLDEVPLDRDRPSAYIEHDTRFINDVHMYIQGINQAARGSFFTDMPARGDAPLNIYEDFIQPLNDSLMRIFGGDVSTTIQLANIQDAMPNKAANLIFKKGNSEINYDLLSHGEKQIIILLINFIVRRKYYDDSIIFIDEMDSHLNTALQFNLIEEIVTHWIPENSQLWTASHSLGFIDYAKKSDIATIIDFDLLNFDYKQELKPASKEKLDVYEIAIPKAMIDSILKGHKLVHSENKDSEYLNSALGRENYLFLSDNNNRDVFLNAKAHLDRFGLRDRDYLKDEEIMQIRKKLPNLKILLLYAVENYLYHPDNIAELQPKGYDKDEYIKEIINKKNDKRDEIIEELRTSRQSYIEFENTIKNDGNLESIRKSLKSDDFGIFYPYFNIKKHYQKNYLAKFQLQKADLAKTQWFRDEILKILKS